MYIRENVTDFRHGCRIAEAAEKRLKCIAEGVNGRRRLEFEPFNFRIRRSSPGIIPGEPDRDIRYRLNQGWRNES